MELKSGVLDRARDSLKALFQVATRTLKHVAAAAAAAVGKNTILKSN